MIPTLALTHYHRRLTVSLLSSRWNQVVPVDYCYRATVFAKLNKEFTLRFIQADRAISTSKLNPLQDLHIQPINVVVFNGSQGRSHLRRGFPLICFQRLSLPNIATRQCCWRNNRTTRGSSTSVLSYQKKLPSNLQRPQQIGTELSHDVLNPARVPL